MSRRLEPSGRQRRAERFAAARAAQDLRRGARVVADARSAREGRAVRLGPREFLGPGPSRTGRLARTDPFATPELWGFWRWVGFVFWAGVTGESLRRAWKRHGGPTGDAGDAAGAGAGAEP
ncbi:MAG: hypothetical protein KY457_13695 [Actinobacteria bacterium]|nr:hypothetical protein [Actinomycetota bacterium]